MVLNVAATDAIRPMDLEPVLDWTKLAREDDLHLVHHNGKTLTSGLVDMIALDGSVFWLIQHDGQGRAMILPEDDVVVFRQRRPRKNAKSC
ncbi:hypothetical protein J7I84_01250 [Arthrobacter sp. ISL-85]|uniref:hypothetical protein n=1 Tax=Arthrobacter sp. ISL-85 TaxID=2819115 RepID=UPI001BE6A12D|nr:hypothetical protein [Arthrobacter sp. ISL-85]MBT2565136.1 hypothetical protein [Arthrobacter sp. ISL-85]